MLTSTERIVRLGYTIPVALLDSLDSIEMQTFTANEAKTQFAK